MIKYNPIPGFTGSEFERTTMASCTFPMETTLERAVKQRAAKYLIRLANYLTATNVDHLEACNMRERFS
jgi:hypothetical protein